MNSKGFTMVELLISISILALLTLMAFPTLRSISAANVNKKLDTYGKSMISSAKLYSDSYLNDMFEDNEFGSYVISFTDLYKKGLLKDIGENNISCKNSYVVVAKNGDNFLYCLDLDCSDKNNELKTTFDNPTECDKFSAIKLTYHSNNGKNQIYVDKKIKDEKFTIKDNIFTKSGYEFLNWYDKDNNKYNPSEIKEFKSDSDLYASWCLKCNEKNKFPGLNCILNKSTGSCDYSKTNCDMGYTLSGSNPSNFKCDPIVVTCSPGTYLNANSTSCSDCESGYFCPGGTFYFSADKIQGRNNCPLGYGKSPVKSSLATQCFMKVEKNYYVKNVNDSSATKCPAKEGIVEHNVNYGSKSSCVLLEPMIYVYKFSNEEFHCSGNEPYVKYYWDKWNCYCKFDVNTLKYSSSSIYTESGKGFHHVSKLFYYNTALGKDSCSKHRNYPIKHICTTEHDNYIFQSIPPKHYSYHGYIWYGFDPTSSSRAYTNFSGVGWYHDNGLWDTRIPTNTSTPEQACKLTCIYRYTNGTTTNDVRNAYRGTN